MSSPVPLVSNRLRIVTYSLLVILIILGAIVAAMFASETGLFRSAQLPNYPDAIVSGTVQTTGDHTAPSEVVFTDSSGTQWTTIANGGFGLPNPTYQGTVEGYFNPARYSLRLPNHASYNVSVIWVGYFGWQGGFIYKGPVRVNVPETSPASSSQPNIFTFDVKVDTPDSWVGVSGLISVAGNSAIPSPRPTNVTFYTPYLGGFSYGNTQRPASDRGGSFSAQVNANGISSNYNLNLPNNANYAVAIDWVSPDGSHGICLSNPFGLPTDLDLSVNVGSGQASYTYNASCGIS